MNPPNIDIILSRLSDFPTLPTVYSSLLTELSNPRSTVQSVANIVSNDQASVTKLLKFVNSAVFGLSSRVDTVTQAIFLIGFNELKNLILALSVMKMFANSKESKEFNVVELWKHSIAVAVITKLLGSSLGVKNVENYFTAGLIHDIGKLVFYKLFNDQFISAVTLASESKITISAAEKKIIGLDHTMIGEILADNWKLPLNIKNCIRGHHRVINDNKIDQLVACVHLANLIATSLELGNAGNVIIAEPNYRIWNELNYKEGAIEQLYESIISQYEQSVSILQLD